MNEKELEQHLTDKGLNAPRITPSHVDAQVASAQYHVFPGTTLTVCCLHLVNGFTVTGESACASPENFDEAVGRDLAFKQARGKIWALEGYLLRSTLGSRPQTFLERMRAEYAELSDKHRKLKEFFGAEQFRQLPGVEQALMADQSKAMLDYRLALADRLSFHDINPTAVK